MTNFFLYFDLWNALGLIALLCLVAFYSANHVIWRAFKVGLVLCTIIAFCFLIGDLPLEWLTIKKIIITVTLCGAAVDVMQIVLKKLKRTPVN